MIERTQDYRRVKLIIDENPMSDTEAFRIVLSSDYFYLLEVDAGKDIGVWCFEPCAGFFNMHSCMTPDCRGKKAVDSGLRAIGWLYENTGADAILAPIPGDLRHAHLIPRAAGLEYVGRDDDEYKVYRCDRELYAKIRRG